MLRAAETATGAQGKKLNVILILNDDMGAAAMRQPRRAIPTAPSAYNLKRQRINNRKHD